MAQEEGGDAPPPLRLFVDREAAATHWVVESLRDGPSSLEAMPTPFLGTLGTEARHWHMPGLAAAVEVKPPRLDTGPTAAHSAPRPLTRPPVPSPALRERLGKAVTVCYCLLLSVTVCYFAGAAGQG